ncbi:DUF6261 family protein [candidate division CSSED10-310 bacterium]|uniref:DUF6261 family protein n=1 Tax=candidate division CSSED10-310 bacterium TaxID=2855610 RepID=A0ABV6YRX3_UNCC1
MKNITLNPSQLSETEKLNIARFTASLITGELAAVIELRPFPKLLESLANTAESYLDQEKENELIQELKSADKERDNAQLSMIYHLVSLVLRHDLPEISQAANHLHSQTFPETFEYVQFTYNVETAEIQKILDTLKSPDFQQLIELTQLESYLEYAQNTQQRFLDIQQQQKQFYAALKNLEELKQSVSDLEHCLLAVINMLEAIYPMKSGDVQRSIQKIFSHINKIAEQNRDPNVVFKIQE